MDVTDVIDGQKEHRAARGGPKGVIMATKRGSAGNGSRGACGGTRKFDGSGKGVGNKNTPRQPKKKPKKKKS